ncbi:Txe/YoeB family addiction module toxin [Methylobacterium sp. 37f]|uniref:Txe/YoeB family addiction module toxin n=1 Tax=Methylobacterium sp. 37f TaxID=2817058 RepID=UPI001FFCBB70|nr:Txe/YoeB family addiction module toxin [Methylobacterium sp. 37f]
MTLVWSDHAWDDYLHGQAADRTTLQRITVLIGEARRHPFQGVGKPEPLKGHLKGWWSRRMTGEHRLVYRVAGQGPDQALEILQCRWHCDA